MSETTGPTRGSQFAITSRSFDEESGTAVFRYELDGTEFSERIEFGEPVDLAGFAVPAHELDALLDACHVAIGTSYFKVSAPTTVRIDSPVSPEVALLASHLYDDGMREFAFTNGLGVPLTFDLEVTVERRTPRASVRAPKRSIVAPLGGGKDSAAVLTLLDDVVGLSVSTTPIQRQMADAAGISLIEVGRHLDVGLADASAAGFNGHVPVTAINSTVSALAARLAGYGIVVMGNERSASEATRVVDGIEVNHQYSKSFDCEVLLRGAIALGGITYFSLLRQLSEITIAGIVAKSPMLRMNFLSCNRAFKRSRAADEAQTWCLECAKCLFTFLCFTPYLSPDEARTIFGGNPLERVELTEDVRDLWREDAKPFDCVGERAESATALALLATLDVWKDFPVVEALAGDAARTRDDLDSDLDALLRPEGPTLTTEPYGSRVIAAAHDVADSRLA